eukprot:7030960-Ditylum_brightwellii.AAC.1
MECLKVTFSIEIKEYYDGIPASDIVDRYAQFLLRIKEAARAADIKTCIVCSILGTWAANSFP